MTDAVRDCYSEVADLYIEMFGGIDRVDPQDLAFLRRSFGRCTGPVLDAGCGPGHLTAYLTDLGLTVSGVDLVPEFVEHARTVRPGIDFTVGSVHSLAIPDGTLGGILAWYSLIHYRTTELEAALAEFRRMAAPGAVLVVGFFDGEQVEPFEHKVTTAYRRPADQMSQLLKANGFAEVDRARRAEAGHVRPHAAIAAHAS
ncbi:class I SAM-dependent methyltransferase [Mycobacterium sp. ITM-2016-00317]|uniref:class I SAM-dependent DNA methyltransferase n=1 Tax=Mycobacterium sp. ITM-2016-00317 TaxID=2099694 RepID=UPI00287FDF40|nr:class I SAM-dependent methyltransferase [Mycobacterium sp. ITM-2016-00317]WNG86380.1 class I SAM-dependent methyltransferase [Mycobacterium sp. ITM-2016-00317]